MKEVIIMSNITTTQKIKNCNQKLNYSDLRAKLNAILCNFLDYEIEICNSGQFDSDYMEFCTDDILTIIKNQGGTYLKEDNNSTILYAHITSVSLDYEDHGILTFGLGLDIADGRNCVFGSHTLDKYDRETKKHYCPSYSMELITRIMKVVGVSKWEDCKGKHIRVVSDGWDCSIKKIGNLMKDEWFDIEEFFKEYKTE